MLRVVNKFPFIIVVFGCEFFQHWTKSRPENENVKNPYYRRWSLDFKNLTCNDIYGDCNEQANND